MSILRRAAVALAATSTLVLAAAPAMAHDCTNSSKKTGAGSAADLYFVAHVVDGQVVGEEGPMLDNARANPQDRPQGGFFTIHAIVTVDGGDPFEFFSKDVYIHQDLPLAPRMGGPGEGMCDGVGIDDLETCFGMAIEEVLAG
jgi:hypothetical protein